MNIGFRWYMFKISLRIKLFGHVKRKELYDLYNKIPKDAEGIFPNRNKYNIYICDTCNNYVLTKDVDYGVTPFIISCETCGGERHSGMYRVKRAESTKPNYEWYRPSFKEFCKLNYKPFSGFNHVCKGGLLKRKVL